MSTKPKPKFNYYAIDTGFLPSQLKLCFSNEVFQQILKDHQINTKEEALELGMAETHIFTEGKKSVMVVVFDLEECDSADPSLLVSTICHESVHCAYRVLEYAGDEVGDWSEETFAYLTDHIAKQIYTGIQVEKHKREEHRVLSEQKGKRKPRTKLQVDQLSDGGTGQNSGYESASVVRGTENGNGQTQRKTRAGI